MNRYAVIGNPVAHSRSPQIHAQFATQTGRSIQYERLLAPLDAFASIVAAFRAAGGQGANVTVPFKEEAFALASACSQRATTAGAANLLRFDAGSIYADNTDGAGVVRDLRDNLGVLLQGKRVLIIGAGGAARGVIGPLLDEQPAHVAVANRTESRARQLAARFPGLGVLRFPELPRARFDVVINATSASLAGERLPLGGLFTSGMLAYDMMYGETPSDFLSQAAACGARSADGLGMLVEQAAESFFVWFGVRPQTQPVLEALRRGA